MDPDDEICLCFHVKLRKVRAYLRANRVQHASQLSDCHGAGTGCGWCRPFLERLFRQDQAARQSSAGQELAEPSASDEAAVFPNSDDYASQREAYRRR